MASTPELGSRSVFLLFQQCAHARSRIRFDRECSDYYIIDTHVHLEYLRTPSVRHREVVRVMQLILVIGRKGLEVEWRMWMEQGAVRHGWQASGLCHIMRGYTGALLSLSIPVYHC
jgi:hypothetical protein